MRSLTLLLISLALLLTPLATAQLPAPPVPVYTVEVLNAPAAFTGLATANATAQVPFSVQLVLANVVCAAQVTIPVTLTATAAGAPAYFSVRPDPEVINITISQGPHASEPVGSPGGGSGDSALKAVITGNITTNASVQVTLVATAPAPPSGPAGCQGAGAISGASSAPVVVFANMTAPPAPPEPTPPPAESPGAGVIGALIALSVAGVWSRKKRGE